MNRSTVGHRIKRTVDRHWFLSQLIAKNMGQDALAKALAKEVGLPRPYDKGAISRRIKGAIAFSAPESQALARIFQVPVAEVLKAIGAGANHEPVVGTLDATGAATIDLQPHEDLAQLKIEAPDAWNGARITFRANAIPLDRASPGIYLVAIASKSDILRQYLGTVNGQVLLCPAFGPGRVEEVPSDSVRSLRKVTQINL